MERDEDFASGEENFNDVWYNYLKDNRASCFDHDVDYTFRGNKGTTHVEQMIVSVDKCD